MDTTTDWAVLLRQTMSITRTIGIIVVIATGVACGSDIGSGGTQSGDMSDDSALVRDRGTRPVETNPGTGGDVGTSSSDTATSGQDGGTSAQDTGTSGQDTGTSGQDTGTSSEDTGSSSQDTNVAVDTSTNDTQVATDTGGAGSYTENGCLILEITNIQRDTRPVSGPSSYIGDVEPALGGVEPDLLRIEFYQTDLVTIEPDTIDLSTGLNTSYAICTHCVRVFQDYDPIDNLVYYFQESGSLRLSEISLPPSVDESAGTLTNVVMRESELDGTGGLRFVEDGTCVFVPFASWDTTGL